MAPASNTIQQPHLSSVHGPSIMQPTATYSHRTSNQTAPPVGTTGSSNNAAVTSGSASVVQPHNQNRIPGALPRPPFAPARMSFWQILAISSAGDPPLPVAEAALSGKNFFIRNLPFPPDSEEDKHIIYRFVQTGEIPDPSPHFLWSQTESLLKWAIATLHIKLNALLDEEASHRPKTALIRHQKGSDHEGLSKWCRTGSRRDLHFRGFPEWITILSTHDLTKDLGIAVLMDLITTAHGRVLVLRASKALVALAGGQAASAPQASRSRDLALDVFAQGKTPVPQAGAKIPTSGLFEDSEDSQDMINEIGRVQKALGDSESDSEDEPLPVLSDVKRILNALRADSANGDSSYDDLET